MAETPTQKPTGGNRSRTLSLWILAFLVAIASALPTSALFLYLTVALESAGWAIAALCFGFAIGNLASVGPARLAEGDDLAEALSEYFATMAQHIALVKGDPAAGGPVTVRMHAVNIFTDALGQRNTGRGPRTRMAWTAKSVRVSGSKKIE